jgi:hypothetical protein
MMLDNQFNEDMKVIASVAKLSGQPYCLMLTEQIYLIEEDVPTRKAYKKFIDGKTDGIIRIKV